MIEGLPSWTAPTWLDPAQVPRLNTAHRTAADLADAGQDAPGDGLAGTAGGTAGGTPDGVAPGAGLEPNV